jgi:8-oxo-dGTP pyrophosphatase MutT (NUDIX family)
LSGNDRDIFSYQLLGPFSQDQVLVSWDPQPLSLPRRMQQERSDFEQSIDKKRFFNGRIARLARWEQKDSRLVLHLCPTDYFTLLFSNGNVSYIVTTYGEQYLSNALGISAVVISRDRKFIFMQRSKAVGEFPARTDVFGGHIDVSDNGSRPCVFTAMEQELLEELSLPKESSDLLLLGLIKSTPNLKPELVFQARCSCDAEEIIESAAFAKGAAEYDEIITMPARKSLLRWHLQENKSNFTPSAYGSLCLFLQCWNRTSVRRLYDKR